MASGQVDELARWKELGQRAADTASRGAGGLQSPLGLPLLHRSITQVAEQTSRLQPSARGEDEDAVLRATRILAGQGLDLPRLRGQLSAVQVAHQAGAPGPSRPLSRLLSAAAGPDPDRFSSSLAAACLHAAAHESLSAAQAAFCSMMDGAAVGAGDARRGAALALMPATAAGPEVAAARRGLAQAGVAGAVLVEGSLEWRYLGAVRELNEGRAGGRSAAEVLGAAAGSGAGAGEGEGGDGGVARLWALLAAMVAALREAGGPGGAAGPAVAALARGARQALEKEHMAFVDKVVHRHRDVAQISGALGPRPRIRGFLRARLRLPPDASLASADLLWQQAYLCLRSGLYQDAIDILRENESVLRSSELVSWLREWVEAGGRVSEGTASRLVERCHRLMTASAPMQTRNAHAVLIHVALSGSTEMHDRFLSEYRVFFSNIEDFLWFKLALVRCYEKQPGGTDFSVEEMQAYLNEYQPRHYSRDGRQPLLYAAVLLLSLQFHAAAAFLVHDPGSVGATHGADAAHLCAAMQMDGLLDAAPPLPRVGPPGSRRADAAAVVRAYAGQQFLARQQGAGHVEAALEYFVAAARMSPDPSSARIDLLQELVVATRAYGTLLGAGGPVGPGAVVARLAGPEGVEALVGRVAERCRDAAQHEAATELFLAAGRPGEALALLVRRMSDLVATAPEGERLTLTQTAEFQDLARRGRGACDRMRGPGAEAEDFDALLATASLLEADRRGDWRGALDLLSRLHRYVPARGLPGEADRCRRSAAASAVMRVHLGDALGAAARAMAAQAEAAARAGRAHELDEIRVRCESLNAVAGGLKLQRACQLLMQLRARLDTAAV